MLLKQEQTLKHPAPALSLPPNLHLSLSLSIFLCKMLVWILHRDFHKRGLWPSLRMAKGDWFILQIWFNGPKSVIKRQLLMGSQFVGDYVKHNVQSSNHAQNFSNLIYHKIKKISFKKKTPLGWYRYLMRYVWAPQCWGLFYFMTMRMSFIGQVCLHIQGICYSDRSSTVQQKDSNRTRYTNIQIGNVQKGKNTIYI